MAELKKTDQTQNVANSDLPNELRRTLLKTSWVVPVISVVGLPAHAQTSPPPPTTAAPTTTETPGTCTKDDIVGTWKFVTDDDGSTLKLNSDGSVTETGDEDKGTWSLSGNTVTIIFNWRDDGVTPPETGKVTLTGTLGSDCKTMSGTVLDEETGKPSRTYPFTATKE